MGRVEFTLDDLVEVGEIGTAIMVIKREVFTKLPRPYFDAKYYDGKHCGEDFEFCKKAREAGIKILMTPWVRSHHIGEYAYPADMRGAILESV
jgi:GT2 family glycosyltransferase